MNLVTRIVEVSGEEAACSPGMGSATLVETHSADRADCLMAHVLSQASAMEPMSDKVSVLIKK